MLLPDWSYSASWPIVVFAGAFVEIVKLLRLIDISYSLYIDKKPILAYNLAIVNMTIPE